MYRSFYVCPDDILFRDYLAPPQKALLAFTPGLGLSQHGVWRSYIWISLHFPCISKSLHRSWADFLFSLQCQRPFYSISLFTCFRTDGTWLISRPLIINNMSDKALIISRSLGYHEAFTSYTLKGLFDQKQFPAAAFCQNYNSIVFSTCTLPVSHSNV